MLNLEHIAAILAIITFWMGVGAWFVTSIVREVIKNDLKEVFKEIHEDIAMVKERVLRLELKEAKNSGD